jgi:hypothetical protein
MDCGLRREIVLVPGQPLLGYRETQHAADGDGGRPVVAEVQPQHDLP